MSQKLVFFLFLKNRVSRSLSPSIRVSPRQQQQQQQEENPRQLRRGFLSPPPSSRQRQRQSLPNSSSNSSNSSNSQSRNSAPGIQSLAEIRSRLNRIGTNQNENSSNGNRSNSNSEDRLDYGEFMRTLVVVNNNKNQTKTQKKF